MPERTTVRLPDELMSRAKKKAATEGRTLTSLIEDGLRRVLADKPPRSVAMPPVSKATGGFAPGVSSLRDVDELEDVEYVERLRKL
jgi:hypothetical protein